MRCLALCLSIAATSGGAWEFSADRVCEITHEDGATEVHVTFDPASTQYAMTLRRDDAPWPSAAVFTLHFSGPRGLTISTDRHVLSDDGAALTVTDSGFGNVLDGLQYNQTATALVGDSVLGMALDGAAPVVAAFRACTSASTT